MKTNFLLRIILFVMIAGMLSLSCSPTNTSEVTIHINLGLDNKAAFNTPENSIIDRILRFFAKDAKAQTAPLGITSIGLSATGEGMSAINNTYPADTSTITLDVPAGTARVFQVTAYRPTGDWGGSSAAYDLEAGQSVEIPITMAAQYASVTINPAYPNGIPASSTLTYTVNVTTSGQVVLSSSFTSGTPFQVPAGDSKDFEVLISTPSVTFRGTSTLDLAAGSSQAIEPSMTLFETKIVIPDYQNNRIVQIDNFTTPNWIPKLSTDLGVTPLLPYDIDFDSLGRIYIANNNPATGGGIIRLDDINDTTTADNMLITKFSLVTITLDRTNNLSYYASSTLLYRYNLTTSTETQLTTTGISAISGLAVDDAGMLYIACSEGAGPKVLKYNPSGTGAIVTGVFYLMGTGTPWDVMYKAPYVYVANLNGAGANSQIIQLNTDLTSPVGFGQNVDALNTSSGNFYGPRRFLAIINRKITIIDDEDFSVANLDKLVSIDDISGTNWETYGTQGSGTDQFNFYFYC